MEHTNWFLPVQPDRNERQSNMDPRARLLKLVIERIELKQRDPTVYVRSFPPGVPYIVVWSVLKSDLTRSSSSTGDGVSLACEIAMLDALELLYVMSTVDKNDSLREVFARAARPIREVFLHAGCSYRDINVGISPCHVLGYLTRELGALAASRPCSKHEYVNASESGSELAIAYTLHAFLTSVLHLLTSVFQYLIGYVDRGGSKTYSSGAFDFRASFVSLLLFQGAYVWIKFRQAARPGCRKRKAPDVEHEVVDIGTCNLKGLRKRSITNSSGAFIRFKYEPRFIPPRQEGDGGTDPCSKRLPLGEYHTPAEAQIVLQIARYYYDKDGGCVELEDGRYKFPIPPMSEQERRLAGEEKRKWVQHKAKQVGKQMYADFQREKGKHLDTATEASSHGAEFNEPSSSALPLPLSSLPMLTTMAMAAEPAIASAAPSSPSVPLLPFDDAIVGDADVFPEDPSDIKDMIDVLCYDPGLPNPLDPQLSVVSYQMHYQGFAQLLGDASLLEVGAVTGGIEHVSEPVMNPSPGFQQGRVLADAGTENIDGRIVLQQSDPVLQQVVFCQKCLGDNARQFVHLDQLKASQIQNLKLQQENESLKSRLQLVASLSCNVDWNHDGHSTEGLNHFGFLEK